MRIMKTGFFAMIALVLVGCSNSAAQKPSDTTQFYHAYGVSGERSSIENFPPHFAHPTLTVKTTNIYIKNKQELKFSDLFSDQEKALQILSDYCKRYFTAKLVQENLPQENKKFRLQMIDTGTAAQLQNYQYWNIKQNYLQITFDRAQVEPSYYGIQTVDVPLSLLANVLNPKIFSAAFKLQPGDLLFQDLDCGDLCDGINQATYGYNHTTVSHVGMVVSVTGKEPMLIEAVSNGVQFSSLDKFLVKSQDKEGHPRVMVGRVNRQTATLIPVAIKTARSYWHYPYNPTFSPNAKGFYCSQLIVKSFFVANHYQPVFLTYPMNFKTANNTYPVAWVRYFAELKQPIPQGEAGSNPGMLSRDPKIKIVYFYGDL